MLTGRYRYRLGWFGRLVLQVEVGQPLADLKTWKDATIEDIQEMADFEVALEPAPTSA